MDRCYLPGVVHHYCLWCHFGLSRYAESAYGSLPEAREGGTSYFLWCYDYRGHRSAYLGYCVYVVLLWRPHTRLRAYSGCRQGFLYLCSCCCKPCVQRLVRCYGSRPRHVGCCGSAYYQRRYCVPLSPSYRCRVAQDEPASHRQTSAYMRSLVCRFHRYADLASKEPRRFQHHLAVLRLEQSDVVCVHPVDAYCLAGS